MERLNFRDLECFQKADESMRKHKLFFPDRCFDLSKLPDTKIKEEMMDFIVDRGQKLTPLSIRTELYPYNLLCKFLSDKYPELFSFSDILPETMKREARKWLVKNGKNRTQTRKRTETGKTVVIESDLIKYIGRIYAFLNPVSKQFCYESDRWYLEDMYVDHKNPVNSPKSISFNKIEQFGIKEEVKKAIYMHLSQKAFGTVCAEVTAINRFAQFLKNVYPEIHSLNEINRDLLEEYLIHTNTEATGRKSYGKELYHLRSVLITAGKILDNEDLQLLFYRDDFESTPQTLYRAYSEAEEKRLMAAIMGLDEQIARALVLHQLLGTRISETLTLTQDSVYTNDDGILMIRIYQIKTRTEYKKAIKEDIKKLFDAACRYTNERYGQQKYVFVDDKNPEKPMSYGRIKYQLMAMVQKNDLRDDNGELFGVGTHIWRRNYGKRLTEQHIDDIIIAKLMGHSGTSSLKNYRRVGNEMMANETRKSRNDKDALIAQYFLDASPHKEE